MTTFPLMQLHDVATVFNGKTPSQRDQRDCGHPVLKIRDVDENGIFRGKFESFVEIVFARRFSEKFAARGDILILNAAHNADYVGSKTFFVSGETVGALVTGEWLVVRPNKLKLDADYAYHWLRTGAARSSIRDLVKGIHLYPKDVARLEIPLAPLGDQRRLSEILNEVDCLCRHRRLNLDLLERLGSVIYNDMFVRNESHEWQIVRIADVADEMRTGPFGSQLLHSEFVDDGIAVLGIDNAVSNEFQWSERRFVTPEKYAALRRYTVLPGDVLITIMGTCGRCAIVPDDIPVSINTKHLCCITLNQKKMLPVFLHASFLRHPSILKQLGVQTKGAVMPGLNMGIIKSLELRIPPLDLQREFVSRMHALDRVRASCRDHGQHLEALFASLQHRAFSGRLTSKAAERELAEAS